MDSLGVHGLAEAAIAVLTTSDPWEKARLSGLVAKAWRRGRLDERRPAQGPPARPARPERPALKPPREVPRRRIGPSPGGRIALLHALAHIELNAIDLAWDILARFTVQDMPRGFRDDWVQVAAEEARHFALLSARLEALGGAYGELPAHDGLWQAAMDTGGDLLARLAVVPMVLEARGLDVTPSMIARLNAAGDTQSAEILEAIYSDEIRHVAAGKRWFDALCTQRGLVPDATWRRLVGRYFKGAIKPPFNQAARRRAGMEAALYLPLVRPRTDRSGSPP